jgi:hypothetical protein
MVVLWNLIITLIGFLHGAILVVNLSTDKVEERIMDKPTKISGLAMKSGVSKNNRLYTLDWMKEYAKKLQGCPIYFEHIAASNAIGKVISTDLKENELFFNGEIFDEDVGKKIKNGLIKHVSVGFDYNIIEERDGHLFYPIEGINEAELSLVASPGIPGAGITAYESLSKHVSESISGELHTGEPSAGYTNFDDCVSKNGDKEDPKGYCATIMRSVEESKAKESAEIQKKDERIKELEDAYGKVTKANEDLKKEQESKISQAKKDGVKEVIQDLNKIMPHQGLVNKWNFGSQRFVQEVKKIAYEKSKGD